MGRVSNSVGDFQRGDEVKVAAKNEIERELAAWERLVTAARNINPFMQSDPSALSRAQLAYRFEALAFRNSPLDRIRLAKHLLSDVKTYKSQLFYITELNKNELHAIMPELLSFILQGSIDGSNSTYIFALAKELFSHIPAEDLHEEMRAQFHDYTVKSRELFTKSIEESIKWAVNNLFVMGLLHDEEELYSIVRNEIGETEAVTMSDYVKFVRENPDEVVGFHDPRHT